MSYCKTCGGNAGWAKVVQVAALPQVLRVGADFFDGEQLPESANVSLSLRSRKLAYTSLAHLLQHRDNVQIEFRPEQFASDATVPELDARRFTLVGVVLYANQHFRTACVDAVDAATHRRPSWLEYDGRVADGDVRRKRGAGPVRSMATTVGAPLELFYMRHDLLSADVRDALQSDEVRARARIRVSVARAHADYTHAPLVAAKIMCTGDFAPCMDGTDTHSNAASALARSYKRVAAATASASTAKRSGRAQQVARDGAPVACASAAHHPSHRPQTAQRSCASYLATNSGSRCTQRRASRSKTRTKSGTRVTSGKRSRRAQTPPAPPTRRKQPAATMRTPVAVVVAVVVVAAANGARGWPTASLSSTQVLRPTRAASRGAPRSSTARTDAERRPRGAAASRLRTLQLPGTDSATC